MDSGSESGFVGRVLLLGLLLRLAFLLFSIPLGLIYLHGDEIEVAWNLANGRGYSFDYYGLFSSTTTEGAFFPPVYVVNVYVLLRVFHSALSVGFQNVLLSLAVAWLLFVFCKPLFGGTTARVALLIAVLYPPFTTRITQGSPVYFKMFLMVLLVMVLQRVWTSSRFGTAFLGGVIAGLLALTMPDVLLYLGLFVMAVLAGFYRPRRRFRIAVLLLLGAALTIAPWTLRNWIRFQQFCLVSNNGGFNLYMGNNARTINEVQYRNIVDLDGELGGELARANEFGRDRILYRESLRYIAQNPGIATRRFLERVVLHWAFRPYALRAMATGRAGPNRGFAIYAWTYAASYALLLLLAVPGMVRSRQRWRELAPIWLALVYSTLVAALFVVQTKMRLIKVEPFLVVFAAVCFAALATGRPGRRRAAIPQRCAMDGRVSPTHLT